MHDDLDAALAAVAAVGRRVESGEVELEIPARPEYLGLARQVVAAAAAVEPRFRTSASTTSARGVGGHDQRRRGPRRPRRATSAS